MHSAADLNLPHGPRVERYEPLAKVSRRSSVMLDIDPRAGGQGQALELCCFVLLPSLLPKQLIKVSHALPLTHLTQRGLVAEVL